MIRYQHAFSIWNHLTQHIISEYQFCVLKVKGSFTCAVSVNFFVSGIFELFDVICKPYNRIARDPSLNITKNGDVNGSSKRNLCFWMYLDHVRRLPVCNKISLLSIGSWLMLNVHRLSNTVNLLKTMLDLRARCKVSPNLSQQSWFPIVLWQMWLKHKILKLNYLSVT